jgi:hypothetical protein
MKSFGYVGTLAHDPDAQDEPSVVLEGILQNGLEKRLQIVKHEFLHVIIQMLASYAATVTTCPAGKSSAPEIEQYGAAQTPGADRGGRWRSCGRDERGRGWVRIPGIGDCWKPSLIPIGF